MAKKKESQDSLEGVLVAAAKSLGAAAGSIAAAVGISAPPQPKAQELVNKSRLPRRQKKPAKKVAAAAKRRAVKRSV